MKNNVVLELSKKQYNTLLNCIMDGMIYNQVRAGETTVDLMKDKYKLTYERYFEIYSIVKKIK